MAARILLSAVGIFMISLALAQTVRGFSVEFALFWLVIALAGLLAAFILALIYVLPQRSAGGNAQLPRSKRAA